MQVSDTSSMFIPLRSPDSGKIASAEEAARLVRDGDTVATGGFVGIGFAEEIAVALEALYLVERRGDRSDRQAAQSHAHLCRGPGRRQRARAQPLWP